jgi:hypothetical protein
MMRAWENRADTRVIDEPFYAHFLQHTGLDHPMREAIIAAGNTDWRDIVKQLITRPDTGIFYQKHITTHWLEHFSTDWLASIDHVFLIREPLPVVASYTRKRQVLTASDLGYSQQAALFEHISSVQGYRPIVLDSRRFLDNPSLQLDKVCKTLGIEFDSRMLRWRKGPRESDGIWEAHWYDAVKQSTGFSPPDTKPITLNASQQRIAEQCQPFYQSMREFAVE